MIIKDLWNRLLAKFRKNDDPVESRQVMELVPEEAPEPVPERKTSDEMIIEMAEGAAGTETRSSAVTDSSQEKVPVEEDAVTEEVIAEDKVSTEEVAAEEGVSAEDVSFEPGTGEDFVYESYEDDV